MSTNDWTIRPASSADECDRALELLARAFVDGEYTTLDGARQLFRRSVIEGEGDFLVGVDGNGEVLGAILLTLEGSRMRQIGRDGEAEFRILAVADHARGRGVGRGLVQECLDRARSAGARRMVLSTQPKMSAARALYESFGFTREPERDWATPEGHPRLVYGMELLTRG